MLDQNLFSWIGNAQTCEVRSVGLYRAAISPAWPTGGPLPGWVSHSVTGRAWGTRLPILIFWQTRLWTRHEGREKGVIAQLPRHFAKCCFGAGMIRSQ